jgi:glycosyltransferase involved in cell wall biosynthesis
MQTSLSTTEISVVIPSRTQPAQATFLNRALASIHAQKVSSRVRFQILIGLDPGAARPELTNPNNVQFIEASAFSQAAALNSCASCASGDHLAILEDDDEWHPDRIGIGLAALRQADFTSSTQLEVDTRGAVIGINDFPTPSGWFMPMSTWQKIGDFNEQFRWRLDNEWLGRLGDSGLKRIHLIEATAPVGPTIAEARPCLAHLVRLGGSNVRIRRHAVPVPLITRMVHPSSGTGQIGASEARTAASDAEYLRLITRFGRAPW